jgi:hypothetical protein
LTYSLRNLRFGSQGFFRVCRCLWRRGGGGVSWRCTCCRRDWRVLG